MNTYVNKPLEEIKEQPLTEREKEIVDTAYRLLEIFDRKEEETIREIRENRLVWEMKDRLQDGSQQGEKVMQLPTLVSTIESAVADQVDNMPDAQLLPEMPDGKEAARQMLDVLHYVLDRRGYKALHRELMIDAHVAKACILQTFWDDSLADNKGDINIVRWPVENFRWDPAFDDIQDGRACFKLMWFPESWYREHYPDESQYIKFGSDQEKYGNEYSEDGENITLFVEYWYRTYNASDRRYRVHCAKLAGRALLEYSEKEQPEGLYAHGMYPFDIYTFRKIQGTPVGRSMVDDFIDLQRRANRLSHYIDENARRTARYKVLLSKGAKIDREQLTDWNQEVVDVEGRVDDSTLKQITAYQLNPQVENHMQWLLETMKRDSGQNQSARGEFGGGITAASAIQSLQEAGTKISRMRTVAYQQVFASMCAKVLWLAAQFYDKKRVFVITGDETRDDVEIRVDKDLIYGRLPKDSALPPPPFTVQVVAQRGNPQRIDAENQMVMQMFQMYVQNGAQVPIFNVISSLNIPGKDRLLRLAKEMDDRNDVIANMTQQMQQMQMQNESLNANNAALQQELAKMADMIGGQQAL